MEGSSFTFLEPSHAFDRLYFAYGGNYDLRCNMWVEYPDNLFYVSVEDAMMQRRRRFDTTVFIFDRDDVVLADENIFFFEEALIAPHRGITSFQTVKAIDDDF